MYATAEGTARYAARFPDFREAAFFRSVFNLSVSSLGVGTYLGEANDETDGRYTDALVAAGENGINLFDTAINYRGQRSERCVAAALQQLQRDEIVVCTKVGFLTPGAVPESLSAADVVGGMHSMAPAFLADQAERSRAALGVDTIDVMYLHNPETQLGFVDKAELDTRLVRAFEQMERLVDQGVIRWYGAATWDGFRKRALHLPRVAELAAEAGGAEHHFRFVQLPFNLGMIEAYVDRPESVLEMATRLGIAVVASATLMQARAIEDMPDSIGDLLPGLQTPAQRAIQFARSTPGLAVSLVGMSRREHVMENLGVARVPPLPRDAYDHLYH